MCNNDFGTHYVVELSDCDSNQLKRVAEVERALLDAVAESGATYVGHHSHQFSPHGVSAVVLISESHFSVHTWPEEQYAALDIFTCGEMCPYIAIRVIATHFGADTCKVTTISRGKESHQLDTFDIDPQFSS